MSGPLRLFEGYGVELEYMIVGRSTLNVKPVADALMQAVAGEIVSEVEFGDIAWNNELVAHVIELKTNGPAAGLSGLAHKFHDHVTRINELLEPLEACLMPTAMHPWMNPFTDTRIWDHEYSAVYEAFNRIFDCRGHGWSNLQSTHLNLPFRGDDEFGRLHAAIRALLPLMPVLSASSPVMDARVTGLLDNRLHVYRSNAAKIPLVTGRVIPEPLYTSKEYHEKLLSPLYADIAPHDPDEILREEWLNARGAIARFDRSAIEIRVLDIQETPHADLAILELITGVLRKLVSKSGPEMQLLMSLDTDELNRVLVETTRVGGDALVAYSPLLEVLEMGSGSVPAAEIWSEWSGRITESAAGGDDSIRIIRQILETGNLSQRILKRTGTHPTKTVLTDVYRELCDCLQAGRMFG